jgi:protochlorophyllide reductase
MLVVGLLLATVVAEAALAKRTVVITGGNRGIGFNAVKQLAATNEWDIILACRNIEAGDKAVRSLPMTSQANVKVERLDLADLKSVETFCASVKKTKLNVLACNAGVQHTGVKEIIRTADGFEDTVGTNHVGHFLLVDLLTPLISPKDGRIVFVGSGVHNPDEPGGNVGSKVINSRCPR